MNDLTARTMTRPAVERHRGVEIRPAWTSRLPALKGDLVTLRDLRITDAPALFGMLSTDEVARFVSRPPSEVEGFEEFIRCMDRERAAGRALCYAIVPNGLADPAGVIQIRKLAPSFETAEWGWALGSPFWGTGVFLQAAHLALSFAFDTLGVHRLEARATVTNGRGNGALRKLGAVREGVLRRALRRDDQYLDQALWTILADEWRMGASSGIRGLH